MYRIVVRDFGPDGSGNGVAWFGDASGGTALSLHPVSGYTVEHELTFGQLVLFAYDWYIADNSPNAWTTVDLYSVSDPDDGEGPDLLTSVQTFEVNIPPVQGLPSGCRDPDVGSVPTGGWWPVNLSATVNVRVRNAGENDALSSVLGFALVKNNQEIQLGTLRIGAIDSRDTAVVPVFLNLPSMDPSQWFGDVELIVSADVDNEVVETEEQNNSTSEPVRLVDPRPVRRVLPLVFGSEVEAEQYLRSQGFSYLLRRHLGWTKDVTGPNIVSYLDGQPSCRSSSVRMR